MMLILCGFGWWRTGAAGDTVSSDEQTATTRPATAPATAIEAEKLLQAALSTGLKASKEDHGIILRVLKANENDLIRGLSVFLKYSHGKYPSSLESNTREGNKMENELKVSVDQDVKSGTLKLNDQMQKELNEVLFAEVFYRSLVRDKRDVKYYGEGTTVAAPGRLLVRWKNDKGGYRVIYFDLRGEDVDARRLTELEQANPPATRSVN
jgi:hypothetical protein